MLPVEWQSLMAAKLPRAAGVYVIRNKVNEKLYVGKSVNLHKRLLSHLQAHERLDYLLYRAMRKYGLDAFEVAVYRLTATEAEAFEAEVEAIASLGAMQPKGYNLTAGGEGASGCVPDAETRQRMSESQTGRTHSEETKARQSESAKLAFREGRVPPSKSAEGLASISQKATIRNTGVVFTDARKANISKALMGRESHGWSAESREKASKAKKGKVLPHMLAITGANNPMFGRPSPQRKGVLLWEAEAMCPKSFESGLKCAEYLGVSVSTLSGWLTGAYPTRAGLALAYSK